MSKSHVKQCSKKLDLVKEVMGRVQLAPNNNQFAIAAHASYHVGLRGRTKLLYSVPPGMGKSRVASTLMYLCQNLERIKHIRYYYTHRKLQNVDSQALQELKIVMPGVELSTQCIEAGHETIAAGNDTLVILDEADDIIVDKDTAIEAHNVVGLTATASSDAIFKGQIASLKWEVVDSKIPSQLNESCPYEKAESVKDFMVATAGRPRLVFGDEEVRKQLEAFAGANGLRLHQQPGRRRSHQGAVNGGRAVRRRLQPHARLRLPHLRRERHRPAHRRRRRQACRGEVPAGPRCQGLAQTPQRTSHTCSANGRQPAV